MIPLIIPGAISLAGEVMDAWKAHAENAAATKAANSADFQQSLKTAAAKLATAAAAQKDQALPADIQTATKEILQSPDVQSIAHTSPSGTVNLQFNSNGDLYASQFGGGLRRITISPDIQNQLQQLNATMRSAGAGAYAGVAHVNGQIAGTHQSVQVNLAAV